jgi:predicted Zn-dependent protease
MTRKPLTSRPRKGWKGRAHAALGGALAAAIAFAPVAAEAAIPVVRDAETETLILDYLRPILKVAKVATPDVRLIPDDTFNAFVTGNSNLFVNVGTIIACQTPNELIGVLAHETGHMAHDDIAALTQQIDDTKRAAMIAGLVGLAAAAAGAATGSQAASGIGASTIGAAASVAQMSILRFRRAQESAADRSAVQYLEASGQSGAGMLATMKRLANDNLLLSRSVNPYLQSHPLPKERVSELEQLLTRSKFTDVKDPPALQARHDLARAKLVGFTWTPARIAQRYPLTDTSLPARYARAILTFRTGKPGAAQALIDDLIRSDAKNPYFYELKGQALLETGNPRAAIAPLRTAISLAPRPNLMKIMLAQALVAGNDKAGAQEAIRLLTTALRDESDVGVGYRALGRAYAIVGDEPMAQLATAEGLFTEGDYQGAREQAGRAQVKLKRGSPAWLRADDIVSYKPAK